MLQSLFGQALRARAHRVRHVAAAARRVELAVRRPAVSLLRRHEPLARHLWLPQQSATLGEIAGRPGSGVRVTELAAAGDEPARVQPRCNVSGNDAHYAKARRRWDSTLCVEVERGSAHGHQAGQFFTADRTYIRDLGVEDWRYFKHGFIPTRLGLGHPRPLDGTVAIVAHRAGYANYAHWVFDVLPRFEILRRTVGLNCIDHFAIGYEGLDFQRESLAALGIDLRRCSRFAPTDFIQARRLIVPTHARYEHVAHSPWAVEWLRRTFIPARQEARRRRLFISRGDAVQRRLLQEDALFSRLLPLGFERVTMAGLTVGASAALFNQAEVVVGAFGSGLMNTIFCEPGTKFVEIASPTFYNWHHWFVCLEAGVIPHAYFGNGGNIATHRPLLAGRDHIAIDPIDCAKFITALL